MATTLKKSLEDTFHTTNLYKILGVEDSKIPHCKIKEAYYKLALQWHPDRVTEEAKDLAKTKFQLLGKVYEILSNPEQRCVYDETGDFGSPDDFQLQRDWEEYWRLIFKKITFSDIESFKNAHRNSNEEINELKQAYMEAEGSLDKIMNFAFCCEPEEEKRIVDIINNLILSGELTELPAWDKSLSKSKKKKRARKALKEKLEAEKLAQKLGMIVEGKGSEKGTLNSLILGNQEKRRKEAESFIARIEAKYAGQKKGSGQLPSEEEFLSARCRLDSRRRGKGKKYY
ncbi:dnaJ homolog subfamily C member 9-like isoform X2 [Zophobas morio]|uniref:dnaJ homolog subfamily C member 9-like isoform X2 n=1 Tax=Zophobas morio TaxID=2755281 RepID=UPI0030836EEC